MYPSALSTVATCSLRRECGISVRSWRTRAALRMRVSMSAIGSVIMGSPARLDHARDLATEGEQPEADPAEFELAVIAASAPAHLAPVAVPRGELGLRIEFCELTGTRHEFFPIPLSGRPERHAELLQESAPLFVGTRSRHEADVEPLDRVDLVVVDLGEDDLLLQAERVVALAVEGLAADALEVARARQGDRDQAVEELPHARAAQGDHRADGDALAELEVRDRLLGAGDDGLLPADGAKILDRRIDDLRVRHGGAEAHVHDDLLQAGHLHRVLVVELLDERGHRLRLVFLEHARSDDLGRRDDRGLLAGRRRLAASTTLDALAALAALVTAIALGLARRLLLLFAAALGAGLLLIRHGRLLRRRDDGEFLAALGRNPDLLAPVARVDRLESNARALPRLRVHGHHLARRDGLLALDDAAGRV